jgi:hypothetical protein
MNIDNDKVMLTEADIEEYFFHHPEKISFPWSEEPGITEWIGRQYRVSSGIIDLLGMNKFGGVAVVELKNVPLESKHLAQVARYAQDIEDACTFNGLYLPVWRILIGRDWRDSHFLEEADAIGVSVMTFEYTVTMKTHSGWRYVGEAKKTRDDIRERVRGDQTFSRLALIQKAEDDLEKSGGE